MPCRMQLTGVPNGALESRTVTTETPMSTATLRKSHYNVVQRLVARTLLTATAVGALACGGGSGDADTAGADTGALAAGAAGDTGMAGMDHSKMGEMDHSAMANMNRSPARDSTQTFLRMMSDHHQGLIAIADSAEERVQATEAKSDAQRLRQKQAEEQQQMLAMLGRQYNDSITPTMMPSNRAMLDSLMQSNGPEVDRTFYHHVIAHHREGIQMMDQHLPHLTGEVRQMTERMRADQQREIQEFERKMNQVGRG